MSKENAGIFKASYVLVTISAMLILPVDGAVALDIHNITITVTEYRFGGVPDSDPYEFSCGVTGDDITAVTVETPGGVVYDLEAWTTAQYNWGFSQDDLTAAELGASFPSGPTESYIFRFNDGADSVTLCHDPTPPTGFANITYPAHNSTDVPLNPEFTWDDCSACGEALSRAVAEEKGDMIDFVWLGDIHDTSWTVGPLRPGRLHWFELSVYTGTTPFYLSTTNSDDFNYNNYFENCSGVYFTTETAKTFNLKFKGDGYFDMEFPSTPTGDLVCTPRGGFDLLNVSHLGLSQVVWELRLDPVTFEFRSGTFTITGANGRDGLEGDYTYFVFTPDPENPYVGSYVLGWNFTGGTGRFEDATGTGHTDGLPDFAAQYAEFEFSGTITVPK